MGGYQWQKIVITAGIAAGALFGDAALVRGQSAASAQVSQSAGDAERDTLRALADSVAELRSQMQALHSQMSDLENQAQQARTDAADLREQLTATQTQLAALRTENDGAAQANAQAGGQATGQGTAKTALATYGAQGAYGGSPNGNGAGQAGAAQQTGATQSSDLEESQQLTDSKLNDLYQTKVPHLLVVVAGTTVEFPNKDPFLHNVFSLFDGKRFDLGFYEAGSSRSVRFDRVGVSFLFCNIHPEMSAVVVAVPTPYFGVSDHTGHVSIANVPNGRYRMEVWSERSLPESLKGLERTVVVSASERTLPAIQVVENSSFTANHKNKFGQDYVPPAGSSY